MCFEYYPFPIDLSGRNTREGPSEQQNDDWKGEMMSLVVYVDVGQHDSPRQPW
jgi:hypothetical protein